MPSGMPGVGMPGVWNARGLAPLFHEGGKTVSVALSQAQYEAMKAASENWKTAKAILREMEKVSRRHIFGTIPGVRRPNPLSKKTLGLI